MLPSHGHGFSPLMPCRRRVAALWSGLLGLDVVVERCREPAVKTSEEIMEILEAYDLTGGLRAAAALAGCDHKTVAHYVALREAGHVPGGRPRRATSLDELLPKIEEWVERSKGAIRADVVHHKLAAMGFAGSERTTRRAVAEAKTAIRITPETYSGVAVVVNAGTGLATITGASVAPFMSASCATPLVNRSSPCPNRLFGRFAPLAMALTTPASRVARRTMRDVSR